MPATELNAACEISPKLCLGGEQWVTLRFYAKPDLTTSEVFKVYGTAEEPLQIFTEFEAYNSQQGLTVFWQNDCANPNNLCTLSDSYMTIGLTEEASISGVSDAVNPEFYPPGTSEDFAFFSFDTDDDQFTSLDSLNPLDLSGVEEQGWGVFVDDVLPQHCKPDDQRTGAFGPSHGGAQFEVKRPNQLRHVAQRRPQRSADHRIHPLPH